MKEVIFKKVHPQAQLPIYATPGSSGMDLFSVEEEILPPGGYKLIKTGLQPEIPPGLEM